MKTKNILLETIECGQMMFTSEYAQRLKKPYFEKCFFEDAHIQVAGVHVHFLFGYLRTQPVESLMMRGRFQIIEERQDPDDSSDTSAVELHVIISDPLPNAPLTHTLVIFNVGSLPSSATIYGPDCHGGHVAIIPCF